MQSLEFLDDRGKPVNISCYFSSGANKGKSKGLLVLAKELKLPIQDSMRLGDLINVLATHRAFQNVSLIFNLFSLTITLLYLGEQIGKIGLEIQYENHIYP